MNANCTLLLPHSHRHAMYPFPHTTSDIIGGLGAVDFSSSTDPTSAVSCKCDIKHDKEVSGSKKDMSG